MVRYRFRKEKSILGTVLRPVADVKLVANGNLIEMPMYIDSGADVSMIPLKLGKALGFKQLLSDVIYEAKGIAGGVPCKNCMGISRGCAASFRKNRYIQ